MREEDARVNYAQVARDLDKDEQNLVASAWAYELAIKGPVVDEDLYLDLVGVYLDASDFGVQSALHLIDQFCGLSESRVFEVLDELEHRFGETGETEAWRLYLRERVSFEEIPDTDYEDILHRTGALMAYYRLYLSTDGAEYLQHVRRLYESCKVKETSRQRWIARILESASHSRGHILEA